MPFSPYVETARQAARIGGAILVDYLEDAERKKADRKQRFDFVTEVDHLSESAIIEFIKRRHPEHHILAEESGGEQQAKGYQWVIDPLDGTKNYIHGFPYFGVSVALLQDGQVVTGAVLDPVRDELFYAERQQGAFLNGERLRVSDTEDLSLVLLATGFPFRAKHLTDRYFEVFTHLFQQVSDQRRAGAASLDLAYVACGRLDGFWELTLNAWDIAAGTLLIEEAGGRVTDFWGGQSHMQTGHVVASNGRIHQAIVDVVGPAFPDLKP